MVSWLIKSLIMYIKEQNNKVLLVMVAKFYDTCSESFFCVSTCHMILLFH